MVTIVLIVRQDDNNILFITGVKKTGVHFIVIS